MQVAQGSYVRKLVVATGELKLVACAAILQRVIGAHLAVVVIGLERGTAVHGVAVPTFPPVFDTRIFQDGW
jgi:hypothetical protein